MGSSTAFAHAAEPAPASLDEAIEGAAEALLRQQQPDGHWVFELEADVTIPAEYLLLQHYLDEIDEGEQQALAHYIRSIQGDHGGWPLFPGGDFNISATVKAYFALQPGMSSRPMKAWGSGVLSPGRIR